MVNDKDNANIHVFGKSGKGRVGRELLNCHKPDCFHYKVCHEWASLGNENFINESSGNCDNYEPITDNKGYMLR